jgi:hypothetical protein
VKPTVHKRHALWSADGTWEMLLRHVQAAADAEGYIDWNITSIPRSPVLISTQRARPRIHRRCCRALQKGHREDRFSICRRW